MDAILADERLGQARLRRFRHGTSWKKSNPIVAFRVETLLLYAAAGDPVWSSATARRLLHDAISRDLLGWDRRHGGHRRRLKQLQGIQNRVVNAPSERHADEKPRQQNYRCVDFFDLLAMSRLPHLIDLALCANRSSNSPAAIRFFREPIFLRHRAHHQVGDESDDQQSPAITCSTL